MQSKLKWQTREKRPRKTEVSDESADPVRTLGNADGDKP
jgi:hypothetical protein